MRLFTDDNRQLDVYSSIARGSDLASPWRTLQTVGVLEWPQGMFSTVSYCQVW